MRLRGGHLFLEQVLQVCDQDASDAEDVQAENGALWFQLRDIYDRLREDGMRRTIGIKTISGMSMRGAEAIELEASHKYELALKKYKCAVAETAQDSPHMRPYMQGSLRCVHEQWMLKHSRHGAGPVFWLSLG